MRESGVRPLHTLATFSRRHIDLQRVAGALCTGAPGAPAAVPAAATRAAG
jgi:hypothetical protein